MTPLLATVTQASPLRARVDEATQDSSVISLGYAGVVGDRIAVVRIGRTKLLAVAYPTLADSGWIEMTDWLNGATRYQAGLGATWTPRMRKLNGVVYLGGLFNAGATTSPLHVFTLPAGFRPGSGQTMLAVPHIGGMRRMDVADSGTMILREQFAGVATTGWHDLGGLSFVAEN